MVVYDEFGPEKILEVYNPKIGMRGFVVIDNVSLGPGKGGIRMTPSVTIDEVAKLARTMTWKNALADLPLEERKQALLLMIESSPSKRKRHYSRICSRH